VYNGDMRKGHEEVYRLSISFPVELGKAIQRRAKENERSFAKEVVWIVQQFLKQENVRESATKV
jgi:hypothetical protein